MILRQAAFDGARETLLKGGLHCHTTRSDGKTEPRETLLQHAANGYDFLALTDHRKYNFQNFAPESPVLVLPGMELDARIPDSEGMCFHVVAVGPDEAQNGYRQDETFESANVANQQAFQPYVNKIRARNNLAIYCHPQWSCTPARSFEKLEGFFAMEIWNSGCALEDELDTDNGFIWDEMLARGKRIYAVASDDGHKAEQHCRGWVRVRAQKTRGSILKALENGAFYASCGPEIYDFCIEDGIARLECSPCAYVHFQYGTRPTHLMRGEDGQIQHAEMAVPAAAQYLRATVMDANGRKAWTNPIFLAPENA